MEPVDEESEVDHYALQKEFKRIMKLSQERKFPSDVKTFDDWLQYIDMDEDRYLLLIRSSIDTRTLFLKRGPQETRINAYLKGLLRVCQANHDFKFVLDPFHCVSYICDYMTKSQKGMSETMRMADEEARQGNMDIKNSVRHIGNKFLNAAECPVQQCCYDILQLPITNSTRKKEFINTNPPELRVGLVKSMEVLEQMEESSKDVTHLSNINRYEMRPRFMEDWCLADYVAKTDIRYVKGKNSTLEEKDDVHDPEQREACDEHVQYESGNGFPWVMNSGHILYLRRKPKVIRYRRYALKSDPENYFRERLMLFTPWRRPEASLKADYATYAQAFQAKEQQIKEAMARYESVSSELDAAYEQYYNAQQNTELFDEYDHRDDDNGEDPVTLDDLPIISPDEDSPLFDVDIGPELGIAPTLTDQDHAECLPLQMTNSEYYKLLGMLNLKQQEFHTHILQHAINQDSQVLCVLHGGAGTGKSTVLHAISEGLQRVLRKQPGRDFDTPCLLIVAPTGKAAYNVNGQTIHRAFFVPASQNLEYRALKWDSQNKMRGIFRGVEWVLVDEFSMVGKCMLSFMHHRLQEIRGNQLPFGGMNMILLGDLRQLKPVKDAWIFEDTTNYSGLTPNLFKDNFEVFELDEIMRQRDDKIFAEALNRIRCAKHTKKDIELLQTRLITKEESLTMPDVPHFYTVNVNKDEYNRLVMERTPGKSVVITAKDATDPDLVKSQQNRALAAAKVKPTSAAGNLAYELTVKEGVRYDITANIDPIDGIVNGTECTVRHIDELAADNMPRCIWVEFPESKIGQQLRRKVGHHYQRFIAKGWTPIQTITRTFVASQHNFKVTRQQFPLQMSAGRTVHKAQSSTHQSIVVDMSGPARCPRTFWEHMHYVAFSRSTSLQGLHITDINEKQIHASQKVNNFLEKEKKVMNLCFSPVYASDGQLTVAFNNVGSLPHKWDTVQNHYNIIAADIIILAETWLSQKHGCDMFALTGFNQLRMDSQHNIGHRGMIMFTKKALDVMSTSFHQTPRIEMIQCVLKHKDQVWTIVGIYKPPTTAYTTLLAELEVCMQMVDTTQPIVMMGDFNVDIRKENNHKFLDHMMERFHLSQIGGDKPTTWDGTHIDLMFTNQSTLTTETVAAAWTQHHTIFATVC
jgi:hypothetical protein